MGPDLATSKPPLLRAIDNSSLSVIVRVEGVNREFIGEQRTDGSWFVQLNVASDQTHSFVASWYVSTIGQNLLVLEQRGKFFASADRVQSNATTEDVSVGEGFDADCDGMSNLAEVQVDSNPFTSPGCGSDSQIPGTGGSVSDDSTMAAVTNNTTGAQDTTGNAGVGAAVSGGTAAGTTDSVGSTDSESTNGADDTPVSDPTFTPGFVPEVVQLDGGCFLMGSPTTDIYRREDERQHQVCVEPFSMGRYEVSFDEYVAFSGAQGIPQQTPFDSNWGRKSRPVINVSWNDAVAYTRWLSELTSETYRLPTEAEWEYAARGGTDTPFWTGEMLRDDEEHFRASNPWGGGIATGQADPDSTNPIGSLKPNPFGLYDMLGNVIEFTCSAYSENYENSLETQCDYTSDTHVARGAAYNYIASWARASTRTGTITGDEINGHVGFRIVREIR